MHGREVLIHFGHENSSLFGHRCVDMIRHTLSCKVHSAFHIGCPPLHRFLHTLSCFVDARLTRMHVTLHTHLKTNAPSLTLTAPTIVVLPILNRK